MALSWIQMGAWWSCGSSPPPVCQCRHWRWSASQKLYYLLFCWSSSKLGMAVGAGVAPWLSYRSLRLSRWFGGSLGAESVVVITVTMYCSPIIHGMVLMQYVALVHYGPSCYKLMVKIANQTTDFAPVLKEDSNSILAHDIEQHKNFPMKERNFGWHINPKPQEPSET